MSNKINWIEKLAKDIHISPVYFGVYELVLFSIFKDHVMAVQKCLLELMKFII